MLQTLWRHRLVGWMIAVCLLHAEIVAELDGQYGLQSVYTFNKESTKETCTLSHAQLECSFVYMRVQTCARRKGIPGSTEILSHDVVFSRDISNFSYYAKRRSLWARSRTRTSFTSIISCLPGHFRVYISRRTSCNISTCGLFMRHLKKINKLSENKGVQVMPPENSLRNSTCV
jgi:hypothetical protein